MTAVNTYTGTTGVALPKEVSSEIWAKAQEESAVMQLADSMTLPGTGIQIPIITGDPTAYWTGETEDATVSNPTFATKTMEAYKLSVLVPFSNEFKRDADALYNEVVRRMPGAIAAKFDATVFGAATKPGENFDTLASATGCDIETNPWAGLVAADKSVSIAGGTVDGYVFAPEGRAILLGATDNSGRPLFVNSTAEGAIDRVVGSPAHFRKAAKTDDAIGFAGDWTAARYGIVEGIKMAIADQATIKVDSTTTINLFQQGMFAVRLDFECGFRIKDAGNFAKLTPKAKATS